ncbi:MAG: hypothetical protein FJX95_02645, partial [Bacteroidetes bacterium]|nr:hypothetical protein [Bacteroidota bacterium]
MKVSHNHCEFLFFKELTIRETYDLYCSQILNNIIMKMKNLSMFALIALVVVFSACSVTKRQYAPGYHVEFKKFGKVENVAEVKKEKVAKSVVATEEVAVVSNEVVAPVAIAPVASVVA